LYPAETGDGPKASRSAIVLVWVMAVSPWRAGREPLSRPSTRHGSPSVLSL